MVNNKKSGQIVIIPFFKTNCKFDKIRPALILGRIPGKHDNWLSCMITSQLNQYNPNFDNIIHSSDSDFFDSKLKTTSLIKMNRILVIQPNPSIKKTGGCISQQRLNIVKKNLISMFKQI